MRPSFKNAAGVSAGLSALFLVVYGGCNWITSQRADVGTICFAWERHIPFVPLMILPYMSIDLFFVAAPFICRTAHELRSFALRIVLAIVAAGVCFLLFPLRFAFARPAAPGWSGVMFEWFRGLDLPYNLAPSLHITFCVLLAATYARHAGGLLRILSNGWFLLIAASAVLTYQHHLLDVAAGLALAIYCFYLVPEASHSESRNGGGNRRIGTLYATGAAVAIALALFAGVWAAPLAWIAAALALVARAYIDGGPALFRKIDGRLSISSRLVLAPVLIGQRLSLIYYSCFCDRWNEVVPGVWIGRVLSEREARSAQAAGVTAVLDLTAEFSASQTFRSLIYRNIQVLDLTAPAADQLDEIVEFIARQSATGVVYVHCKIGYSRSVVAVGAYLLQSGRARSVVEAVEIIRRARHAIITRPEVLSCLEQFQRQRSLPLTRRAA